MNNFLHGSILTFFLSLITASSFAQLPYNLMDGRQHKYCKSCQDIIDSKPKEVLFGIQINSNGDIYFSMTDKEWFHKIFKSDAYGVTVDLVSKDRYSCTNTSASKTGLPKGTLLMPVYRNDLLKGMEPLTEGAVFVKIGKVPDRLIHKQLEGNLVIVNGNLICFYSNFLNIDRNVWQLLPMGLFTDSLIQPAQISNTEPGDFYTYSQKATLVIPFQKGSTGFNSIYLNRFYDSIQLSNYHIRKIEIRAYSSVEGSEKFNKELVQKRADTILQALKKYAPSLKRINVLTAENWMDFFSDIHETALGELEQASKAGIKQKLTDKNILAQAEPLLAKERKAVVTLYLEKKSAIVFNTEELLLSEFKKAVSEKNINNARAIQKELTEQILDNKLPTSYLNKLEVPQSKEFSMLLNDREVYRYLLKATSEYEALNNFLLLQQLDHSNGHIAYNICTLRFFMWQFGGDTTAQALLSKEINHLPALGINNLLVKRMLINYHILNCEDNMRRYNYDGKDSSLETIRSTYDSVTLNDEDIYSLAKYFAYYAHHDWAEEIITPRMDKIDVSEDLLFYYINLQFFNPSIYDSDEFQKACINAVNIHAERFCQFFLPNDKGGASMQLLDYDEIKSLYCESCK